MGGVCNSNYEVTESQMSFYKVAMEFSNTIKSTESKMFNKDEAYDVIFNSKTKDEEIKLQKSPTKSKHSTTTIDKEVTKNTDEDSKTINFILEKEKKHKNETVSNKFTIKFNTSNFIKENKKDINQNYELGEKLGKGSFGIVYIAENKIIKSQRAMKKIKLQSNDEVVNEQTKKIIEKTKLEIFNEISILRILDHPFVLKLYEFYNLHTSMYIVTEFCSGGEMLKKTKKIPSFQAAAVMYQVFSAINYYQSKKVIHRDLKPENILIKGIDSEGLYHIRIIDFGVALVENDNLSGNKKSIAGSITYMAPELFTGYYSYECDLWSCGVIMFQLLTGQMPFDGENENELIEKIKSGKYNKSLTSTMDSNEKKLIESLLEPNPKKRINVKKVLEHNWFKAYNLNKVFFNINRDEIFKLSINLILYCQNMYLGLYSPIYTFSLMYIMYNLSIEDPEINLIFRLFNEIDINKSSKIDINAFTKYMSFLSLGMNKYSEKIENFQLIIKACFDCIDLDNDGYIEFTDLVLACYPHCKVLKHEYLSLVFDLFDDNHSGEIKFYNLLNTFDSRYFEQNNLKENQLTNAEFSEDSFNKITRRKMKEMFSNKKSIGLSQFKNLIMDDFDKK